MASPSAQPARRLRPLPNFIFLTRWLQLPLYLGLILAQCVYVYHFWVELVHLLSAAMGSREALTALVGGIGYELTPNAAATSAAPKLTETVIMLAVLGLIDVVMISNLLIMVIVGGYETFVSRMGLEGHPDEPEWLSHVNASVLKVKLATAIIGISSIHLLKTFISAGAPSMTVQTMMWQTIIHITFLVSAIAIAYTDRLLNTTPSGAHRRHPPEEGCDAATGACVQPRAGSRRAARRLSTPASRPRPTSISA